MRNGLLLLLFLCGSLASGAIKQLTSGTSHHCALFDDGRAKCWGANDYGGLGHMEARFSISREARFLAFDRRQKVRFIAAGNGYSCAILDDDTVRCWGFNGFGQVARPSNRYHFSKFGEVHELPGEITEEEREFYQSLGNRREFGFRGSDYPPPPNARRLVWENPSALKIPATPVALSTGYDHACALLDNHAVYCWGTLGGVSSFRPAKVPLEKAAVAVVSGHGFSCALAKEGDVYCWGSGSVGELGRGSNLPAAAWGKAPIAAADHVRLGTKVKATAITAGKYHACALTQDHRVKCWGYGLQGSTGSGSTKNLGDRAETAGDNLPYVNLGALDVNAVQCGLGAHCCAVLSPTDTLRCWGTNHAGQLGRREGGNVGDKPGDMGEELPFVDLGKLMKVRKLAVGADQTCVELSDESLRCWGARTGSDAFFNATPVKVEF
jgi:alpha-tubulin suppressor-like RCC1 family protein